MDTLPISKFKATCLGALERVRRTRRPLRITRFGKPIADIIPPAVDPVPANWLGCMKDTLEIRGDILSPASELSEWDALR